MRHEGIIQKGAEMKMSRVLYVKSRMNAKLLLYYYNVPNK